MTLKPDMAADLKERFEWEHLNTWKSFKNTYHLKPLPVLLMKAS